MSDTSVTQTQTASNTTTATPLSPNTTVTSGSNPVGSAAAGSSGMTFAQVMDTWIQAGGNPQSAQMAAAVADASSGLNPNATTTNPDGTVSVGLWLIPQNGTPPGSTDPVSNARAALQLSNNGTDWSQWCVTWSDNNCGLNGGTYLGSGSNALGSLAGQLGNSSYNVIGSSPTGTGTSASSAATIPGTTSSSTSSSISKYLWIAALVGVVAIVFFMSRKASGSGAGKEGSGWTPDQVAALSSDKSDADLAKELGRSRHAIHVKRSRTTSDQDYTH